MVRGGVAWCGGEVWLGERFCFVLEEVSLKQLLSLGVCLSLSLPLCLSLSVSVIVSVSVSTVQQASQHLQMSPVPPSPVPSAQCPLSSSYVRDRGPE